MLQSISFHTSLSTANQFCLEKVEKGGAQPKVAPPKTLEGEFLNCEVNGVKCQALLDTAAEATIIFDVLYHRVKVVPQN